MRTGSIAGILNWRARDLTVMVPVMPPAKDRGPLPRVAWALLICAANACGPTVKVPAGPGGEPDGVVDGLHAGRSGVGRGGGGRQVLIGEMCPQGAAGRPAVSPIAMRSVTWTDHAADLTSAVERGSVPRFVVLGVDGKLAGVFDTMGIVDVGLSQAVAAGAYAGASPCTFATPVVAHPKPGEITTRTADPRCEQATNSCGIAIGDVVHPDDPPATPSYVSGGACISGDQLSVDIDGDGRIESFPLAGVLDAARAPATEWTSSPTATAACDPKFAFYGVKLTAEADPGKAVDARSLVTLDVLGVVDVDGDGRRELVLALQFATVRTILVYTATAQAQRLELAGEATSFPR